MHERPQSRVCSALSVVGNKPDPFLQSRKFIQMFSIFTSPAHITKIICSLKLYSSPGLAQNNSKCLKNTKMYSSIILAKNFGN